MLPIGADRGPSFVPGSPDLPYGANGFYDVQDASAPEWNLRGRFTTNADGEYALVTEKPVSCPVPTDRPVGRMLHAAGRHRRRQYVCVKRSVVQHQTYPPPLPPTP